MKQRDGDRWHQFFRSVVFIAGVVVAIRIGFSWLTDGSVHWLLAAGGVALWAAMWVGVADEVLAARRGTVRDEKPDGSILDSSCR